MATAEWAASVSDSRRWQLRSAVDEIEPKIRGGAANADANQSTNDNGTGGDFVHTPLFKAASQNYSECVRLLLAANADVNQATIDEGATPLFIGCLRGSTECVRLLLAANADRLEVDVRWR